MVESHPESASSPEHVRERDVGSTPCAYERVNLLANPRVSTYGRTRRANNRRSVYRCLSSRVPKLPELQLRNRPVFRRILLKAAVLKTVASTNVKFRSAKC